MCNTNCTFNTTFCNEPICGNNIKEEGEECDGTDLGGINCKFLGFYDGEITCSPSCKLNITQCNVHGKCGDGVRQAQYEECDNNDLGGQTCESLGYYGGTLTCSNFCKFNLSSCKQAGWCGDGIIQTAHEVCDGTQFGVFALECHDCTEVKGIYQFGSDDLEKTYGGPRGAIVRTSSNGEFTVIGNTRGLVVPMNDYQPAASNIYVKKFNDSGEIEWEYQYGNGHEYTVMGLAMDDKGSVYIGNTIQSGTWFGLPLGTSNDVDILLLKFTPTGNIYWYNRIGTNWWDGFFTNLIYKNGFLYGGGYTYSDWANENIGNRKDDVVIVADSTSGEVLSVTQQGTSNTDFVSGINVSKFGYIYSIDSWNLSFSNKEIYVSYLRKLNPSGQNILWEREVHTGIPWYFPIHTLATNNKFFYNELRICGALNTNYGDATNDGTTINSKIFCYDGLGNEIWLKTFSKEGEHFQVSDLTIYDDILYVVGTVGNWDYGDTHDLYDDIINTDGFLMALNVETGEQLWYMESSSNRTGTMFQSIDILKNGWLVIGGGTQDELQQGKVQGLWDAFVMVYKNMNNN